MRNFCKLCTKYYGDLIPLGGIETELERKVKSCVCTPRSYIVDLFI